jgi:hypothetical protein
MDGMQITSPVVAPDLATAKEFWRLFTGDADTPIRVRFIYEGALPEPAPNGVTYDPLDGSVLPVDERGNLRKPQPFETVGTLDQLWRRIIELQVKGHRACYFFPNRVRDDVRGYTKDSDIEEIRALFIDADSGIPAEFHVEPSLIVHSSTVIGEDGEPVHKGQIYWLIADGLSVENFKPEVQRLIAHYSADPSVCNPARILRLPGTLHQKDAPQLVTFQDRTSGFGSVFARNVADVTGSLPPPPDARERPTKDRATTPETTDWYEAARDTARAVTPQDLRLVLAGISPACGRDEWFPIVRAISETRLIGDENETTAKVNRRTKYNLGLAWFNGYLFHRALTASDLEHFRGEYRNDQEFASVFNAPSRGSDGYSFGTLIYRRNEDRCPSPPADMRVDALPPPDPVGAPYGWSNWKDPYTGGPLPLGSDGLPRFPKPAEAKGGEPPMTPQFGSYAPDAGHQWSIDSRGDVPKTDHPRANKSTMLRLSQVFNLPDPTPLIDGLLMEGENVAFVGPPKSGKSFVAVEIGMAVAHGRDVVGHHKVRRTGPVVYLSGEGHAGMKRRLMAWCQERGIPFEEVENSQFYYNRFVPKAEGGEGELKAFIEVIRETVGEPVLVVIDTMARSLGGLDENAAMSANAYLEMTEGLRDGLKCTVLTIAHATNKDRRANAAMTPDNLDFRGSSGFSAGFDSTWITTRGEDNKTVTLTAKWAKDAPTDDAVFYFKSKVVNVEGMENGGTVVLEFATKGDVTGATAEALKQRGFLLQLRSKLEGLGLDSQAKGLTDQEFAEAWHNDTRPRLLAARLRGKDMDDYIKSQPVERQNEIEVWRTNVAKTKADLVRGANPRKNRRGEKTAPVLGAYFSELVRAGHGDRPVRVWYLRDEPPSVETSQ